MSVLTAGLAGLLVGAVVGVLAGALLGRHDDAALPGWELVVG